MNINVFFSLNMDFFLSKKMKNQAIIVKIVSEDFGKKNKLNVSMSTKFYYLNYIIVDIRY